MLFYKNKTIMVANKESGEEKGRRLLATNRDAGRSYEVLETYDAGIVLDGSEVKSLRTKGASLAGAFGRVERGELYLWNLHIPNYPLATIAPPDPRRPRKLLLRRSELRRIEGRLERGLTLVPLELYFSKRGWAKVSLALARGKRGPDRRDDLKRRAVSRELEKSFKGRFRT